ncbi:MAG: hypothetical protein EAZ55_14460 [Cytophagales bacterium]|nr:MAG: hypothetical protein EAZ55_14460 [Cytophagales bacterium]
MNNAYEHWILEVKNHIAYLTLNRANKKNRLDETTLKELAIITEKLNDEVDVWVVIIQAVGDCFKPIKLV